MDKIIYFENNNPNTSICSGSLYFEFLDYAFNCADYFMLVYVNYYGKGYSSIMKEFSKKLQKFKVKSRSNPSWPGTQSTYSHKTTYKIVFYRTDLEAKEILKTVSSLNMWSSPTYPQDLAFFKKEECWFYSVGHENIAAILRPTDEDYCFVEKKGLAHRRNAKPLGEYYDSYNEIISS